MSEAELDKRPWGEIVILKEDVVDFHNIPDKRHTGPDEGDYVEHGHDWVDVVAVFSYNHLKFT